MKRCTACAAEKPVDEFYSNRRGGHMAECKKCHTARGRVNRKKSREADPEGYVLRTSRAHRLRVYGMTSDDVLVMLSDQNGACAVCLLPLTERTANVDHCHATNRVRGLLCKECNIGLGRFCDSPENLDRAAEYVRRVK